MHNLRLALVALAAPLLLVSCNKEQNDTPAPATQEETADATTKNGCPAYTFGSLPGYPETKCGCMDETTPLTNGMDTNKKAYWAAGASLDFIASAMMETDNMGTTYPKGPGDGKTGDQYNAGAAKQNWYMIRSSRNPAFPNGGGGPKNYRDAERLGRSRKMDVESYRLGVKRYGLDKFLAGHRNGTTGLGAPNTYDIKRFRAAHEWTKKQIQKYPASKTNRVRFWVTGLPNI